MNNAFRIALASTAALAIAAPAMAQYQQPNPPPDYQRDQNATPSAPQYQPTPQSQEDQQRYQEQQQQYQQQRDAYDQKRDSYDQSREGYAAARAEYDRRLAAYNRARSDYDHRYGYGAYVRVYGPAPIWDERHWAYYVPARPYAPAAPYYGANTAYAGPPIHCDHSATVGAGVIGALAGAVLGAQLSAPGRHTENAVLGGVVGGGIGAAVGHAHDKYKCDQRGPYFSYNETIPYREDDHYRTPRYAEYQRMGCRLATAPVDADGRDYRYVRVCPDPNGRYRVIG
jgi:hypothetical protein